MWMHFVETLKEKRWLKFSLVVGAVLLVSSGFYYLTHSRGVAEPTLTVAGESEDERREIDTTRKESTETQKQDKPDDIVVHVAGAVKHPGVYHFKEGDRINDAVIKASPLPTANINNLNLAAKLVDGDKVVVPDQHDKTVAETATGAGTETATQSQKVSLNRADQKTLETLPGIGPSKAQAIITYRQKNGGFKNIEELKDVPGFGDKMYERVADAITL